MEGLSRALAEARRTRSFQGINFGTLTRLSHLLFVDDVTIFCRCVVVDCLSLNNIPTKFSATMDMAVNERKSTIYLPSGIKEHQELFTSVFPFELKRIEDRLKYLGHFIKPNSYGIANWSWLVAKVEQKINHWCNWWISRGGRLVLIKSISEVIPIFWYCSYFPCRFFAKLD
jgi:hypothetical protein